MMEPPSFISPGGDELPTHDAEEEPPIFKAARQRAFGAATCFLCARRLTRLTRTDEHVVPQWIQARYDLWQKKLVLLNGTTLKYAQLTIPCCDRCNSIHLQGVETRVCAAFEGGRSAVEALSPWDLHIWLGKMFYGVLYKELFLRSNIRSRGGRTITDRSLLRQMNWLHFTLQGARHRFSATAAHWDSHSPLSLCSRRNSRP
jgi:hypothetical protein